MSGVALEVDGQGVSYARAGSGFWSSAGNKQLQIRRKVRLIDEKVYTLCI